MHDQSDVGFVDAHAEGVGADDDAHAVLLPVALALVFHLVVQSSMIEGGAESSIAEFLGNLLGASATAHINDGGALGVLEGVDEFLYLVGTVLYQIGKVLALKAHSKHGKTVFHTLGGGLPRFARKLLADVLDNLRCCGGGKCQHGNVG